MRNFELTNLGRLALGWRLCAECGQWFDAKGKPLIYCHPCEISPSVVPHVGLRVGHADPRWTVRALGFERYGDHGS